MNAGTLDARRMALYRKRKVVNAGEDGVAVANQVDDVGDAPRVVARLLDARELRLVGQFDEHLRRDVHLVCAGGLGAGLP